MANTEKNTSTDKEKKEEEEEKKLKNYANNYKGFWDFKEDNEKKISQDRPEFHIYISHQKMGTETAAVPYEDQEKTDDEDKEDDENKKTTTTTSNTNK